MTAAESFEMSASTHPRTQRYVTTFFNHTAVRNLNPAYQLFRYILLVITFQLLQKLRNVNVFLDKTPCNLIDT
jgi:hypothetical protein